MSHTINIIEEIIKKFGLNKTQLAKKTGVSDVTIGRYLENIGPADHKFLTKLLDVFPSLKAYWILTGKGEMEWGGADEEFKFLCENILNDVEVKKTLYYFLKWQQRKNNGYPKFPLT